MEHLLRHCEKVAVGPYSRDARALAHEVIDTISAGVPPEQLILPWMSVKEGLPDANSGRYVCAYTPAKSQDRRYQLVSAAMFPHRLSGRHPLVLYVGSAVMVGGVGGFVVVYASMHRLFC